MNTDKSSTHGHRVGTKPTTNTGVHSHTLSAVDARLAALEAAMADVVLRITKVENGPPLPPPVPPPIEPTPGTKKSLRATSVPSILSILADDTVDEIVVANGTYVVSGAANQAANSLWIDDRFASRTRPVVVKAETTGGVTFEPSVAAAYFGGITFLEGAHHQTWQGFKFTKGNPRESGVIVFGGYSLLPPPHHITLRNITVSGLVNDGDGDLDGYPIYFSMAATPGPHDLLIEDFTAVDTGVSGALLHFYHDTAAGDPAGNFNAQDVVIRRATLTGTPQPIMVWADSINRLLFEDVTISGAGDYAIRYEHGHAVTFRRVVSTGSGSGGFYSSHGANPAEVTFESCDLH